MCMHKLYSSTCYGDRSSSLIDGTLIRLRLCLSAANQRAAQSKWGLMWAGFVRSCWHSSRIAVWDSLESAWSLELPCRRALLFFREKFPRSMRGVRHKMLKILRWVRVFAGSGNTGASSSRVQSAALQRDYSRDGALSHRCGRLRVYSKYPSIRRSVNEYHLENVSFVARRGLRAFQNNRSQQFSDVSTGCARDPAYTHVAVSHRSLGLI